MKKTGKPVQISLIAVFASLSLALLACSVDLGLPSKPDPDDFARRVDATLTAVSATRAFDQSQSAWIEPTETLAPAPTSTFPPTDTSIPTETMTPTPEGITVSKIVFSAKVDKDKQPVNPATQFKKGTTTLYGSFSYSGFKEGAKVGFRWDVQGKEFSTITRDWSYGSSGNFWTNVFWMEGGGLPAGLWKLSIYVDGELVQSGTCTIYQ